MPPKINLKVVVPRKKAGAKARQQPAGKKRAPRKALNTFGGIHDMRDAESSSSSSSSASASAQNGNAGSRSSSSASSADSSSSSSSSASSPARTSPAPANPSRAGSTAATAASSQTKTKTTGKRANNNKGKAAPAVKANKKKTAPAAGKKKAAAAGKKKAAAAPRPKAKAQKQGGAAAAGGKATKKKAKTAGGKTQKAKVAGGKKAAAAERAQKLQKIRKERAAMSFIERMRRTVARDLVDWALALLGSPAQVAALCARWGLPQAPTTGVVSRKTHLALLLDETVTFDKVPLELIKAVIAKQWAFVSLYLQHDDWPMLRLLRPPSKFVAGLDYADDALRNGNNAALLQSGAMKLGPALQHKSDEDAQQDDQLQQRLAVAYGDTDAAILEWEKLQREEADKRKKQTKKKSFY